MTHWMLRPSSALAPARTPAAMLLAVAVSLGFALQAFAQAPAAPTTAAAAPADTAMDALVGPIALYPDDLVAVVLPASTSPLQIVQADRWLDKRKADPQLPIDDKWDDAVKTLLNYPDVVKMMSNDLDWISALGEAVVSDQGAVLEGIQSFRRRAQATGNLKSDDKQVVKADNEIIVIEPADPQVVYVPQYTPSTVVTSHSIERRASTMNVGPWLRRLALALVLAVPAVASAAPQRSFATPEAAVEALKAAFKADSDAALLAIFGDEYKDLIVQSDRAAASATRAKVLASMQTLSVLRDSGPDRRVLLIGAEAWPMPIPIVRSGERWRFASEEGADEILNRQIGANEHAAIHVLRAYIDAQRAYASKDRDGDGVLQYARRLGSTPGKHDGLYWDADAAKGEEPSPFGPLIAESAAYLKGHAVGDPYRGYRFRILTRQGKNAPGDAYDYLINGRLLAGFALIAYPADYGRSGVMSFIVNQNGRVYEKDLGENSAALVAKMSAFDPGPGWEPVAP